MNDRDVETALVKAVREGNIGEVCYLLRTGGNPNMRGSDGDPLLHIALFPDLGTTTRTARAFGARYEVRYPIIDEHVGYPSQDLYDLVVRYIRMLQIADVLLEYGADVSYLDGQGETISYRAIVHGNSISRYIIYRREESGISKTCRAITYGTYSYGVMKSVVSIYPQSLYQKKDRSKEYMPDIYTDIILLCLR
jgi:hypothetical protein